MKRCVFLSLMMLVILAGLLACGNKGPLYLPQEKQAPATPGTAPPE